MICHGGASRVEVGSATLPTPTELAALCLTQKPKKPGWARVRSVRPLATEEWNKAHPARPAQSLGWNLAMLGSSDAEGWSRIGEVARAAVRLAQ